MKYLVFIIILITLLYFNFSFKTKEGFEDNEKPEDIGKYIDLRNSDTIEINWFQNFEDNKKIIISPEQDVTWKNAERNNHKLKWEGENTKDGFLIKQNEEKSITFNQSDNHKLFTYSLSTTQELVWKVLFMLHPNQ